MKELLEEIQKCKADTNYFYERYFEVWKDGELSIEESIKMQYDKTRSS